MIQTENVWKHEHYDFSYNIGECVIIMRSQKFCSAHTFQLELHTLICAPKL